MDQPLLSFEQRGAVSVGHVHLAELVHPDDLARISREFREHTLADQARAYVLDLSALTYLTSAAIGMLINTHAHLAARNVRFALVASGGLVAEILGHTHLETIIPIHSTVDEAVARLT